MFKLVSAGFKQEGEEHIPDKQETKSIRLSRFATHNAFHHCEQCQHYCEAGPATQVSAQSTDLLYIILTQQNTSYSLRSCSMGISQC